MALVDFLGRSSFTADWRNHGVVTPRLQGTRIHRAADEGEARCCVSERMGFSWDLEKAGSFSQLAVNGFFPIFFWGGWFGFSTGMSMVLSSWIIILI